MQRRITFGLAAAMLAAAPAFAQDAEKDKGPTLKIGDDAPAIDITHWVKGKQIDEFEDGKVYVIEFWATWCGPCIASMPHVSELQEKYRDYDVTVIGVSDEPLQTVVSFLFKEYPKDKKIHNERINYTLTTDPDESVKKAYFRAAGQRGIPCAFIVGKDQKVEWFGHPMTMDEPLEKIVHDEWDRQAYLAEREKAAEAANKTKSLTDAYQEALADEDWSGAVKAIDALLKADKTRYAGLQPQKFLIMIRDLDPSAGYAYGSKLCKDNWDNAMLLNTIAWYVVDEKGIEHRDLEFAMETAVRASELTMNTDPMILDTLARVHYEQGDLAAALRWQRAAVAHLTDEVNELMAAQIREVLEKYEAEADDV